MISNFRPLVLLGLFCLATPAASASITVEYSSDDESWHSTIQEGPIQYFRITGPKSAWVIPLPYITVASASAVGVRFPGLAPTSPAWSYLTPWNDTIPFGAPDHYGPFLDTAFDAANWGTTQGHDPDKIRSWFIPLVDDGTEGSNGDVTQRVIYDMGNWESYNPSRVLEWEQLIHADDNDNNDPRDTPDKFSIWHLVMKSAIQQLSNADAREFLHGTDPSGRLWLDSACANGTGDLKLHIDWVAVRGEDPVASANPTQVPGIIDDPEWLGNATGDIRVFTDFDIGGSNLPPVIEISAAPHGRLITSGTGATANPGGWAHVQVSRPLATTAVFFSYTAGGNSTFATIVGKRKNGEVTGFKFKIPINADVGQTARVLILGNEDGDSDLPSPGDTWADVQIQ